jgi:CheY-like chemotaxis protein
MPVLDGLAATRAIRQKELSGTGLLGQTNSLSGARLPIIAVTANVRREQVDAAMAAGAVSEVDFYSYFFLCKEVKESFKRNIS